MKSVWVGGALFLATQGCKSKSLSTSPATSATPSAAAAPSAVSAAAAVRSPDARAAEAPKRRDAAQQKAWAAAMKNARARFRSKDYAAAVRAFDEALEVSPRDAETLSELGWAAFNGQDLKRAEEATRESLRHAATPQIKGASLYNLGRIKEARQQNDKAIDAYEKSLDARPNSVVLVRLRTLAPERAERFAPLAFSKVHGPFATMEEVCAKTASWVVDEPTKVLKCTPELGGAARLEGASSIANVEPPFQHPHGTASWLPSRRCFARGGNRRLRLR